MNYSHWCKYCGETFFSDDKGKIAEFRKKHKFRFKLGVQEHRVCPLEYVSDGSVARKSLIPAIEERLEKRRKESQGEEITQRAA